MALSSIHRKCAVLLPAWVIIGVLLLRFVVGELRCPGSTCQQWLFLRKPHLVLTVGVVPARRRRSSCSQGVTEGRGLASGGR